MNSSMRINFSAKDSPRTPDALAMASASVVWDKNLAFPDTDVLWAARVRFSAAEQAVSVYFEGGTIDCAGGWGIKQWVKVYFPEGGGTPTGAVTVTLTTRHGETAPIPVSLPVGVYASPEDLIAAIYAALSTAPEVTQEFEVWVENEGIHLRPWLASAYDDLLALNIYGAGLETLVYGTTTLVMGSAGPLLERRGGSGNNAFGEPLPTLVDGNIVILQCSGESGEIECYNIESELYSWPAMIPGMSHILVAEVPYRPQMHTFTCTSGEPVLDIIVLGTSSQAL